MNHYKNVLSMLTLIVVATTVPLAVAQFKKVVEKPLAVDVTNSRLTSKSPYKQPMPPAMKAEDAPDGVKIRGLVINSDTEYIGEFTVGNDLSVRKIRKDENFESSGYAFYAEGKYYMQYVYSESFGVQSTCQMVYDASTWDFLEEREHLLLSSSAACMTYDPIDCAAYGYFRNDETDGSTWQIYGRMNLATGEVQPINSVDDDDAFMCIAASPDGSLYGVDVRGQYCRIEKATGKITVLGHTDVKPYYLQGAVIDRNTGKFYWAGMTDTGKSSLYEIDPETYIARKIGDFPQNQEFIGLYIVEENEAERADEVEALTATFDKASLSGTVTFTAPVGTVDGSALKGEIKGHAAVDGNHFETTVQPGAECALDIAVRDKGLHIITVWVSDDNGEGKKTTLMKWVGADQPAQVSNVNLVNDNGHLTVTWDAPGGVGIHGGYVDTDEIRYVIDRDGGGFFQPIRDYKGTSFEMDVPNNINDEICFCVRAVYDGLAAPSVYSNKVYVGMDKALECPVELNAGSIQQFIVIDGNNDGTTWTAGFGYASCESYESGTDDWMLTPMINLSAGTLYQLSYDASAQMGVLSPQIIEVFAGMGDTADDMTIKLDEQTVKTIRLTFPETYTVSFTVPESGAYRLGFHNTSENDGALGLLSINLEELSKTAGPQSPDALSVTPAERGELSATISFTAPTLDNEGNPLEALSKVVVSRSGNIVGSVENPVPGKSYNVVDTNAAQGENIYEVYAVDASGTTGIPATVKGWVGTDIPLAPVNVDMKEVGDKLVLTWALPEKGSHGGYVNPDEVTYSIVHPTYMQELGSVRGGNSAEFTLTGMDAQAAFTFGIMAMNSAGTSAEMAVTPTVVAGPGYKLPFWEHFKGLRSENSWYVIGNNDEDDGWAPVEDKGPDGQPGVSTFWGQSQESRQSLISGKISLKNCVNPILRLYVLGNVAAGSPGITLTLSVSESFSGEYITLQSKHFEEGNTGWIPVEISLADYVGKDVFLNLTCTPEGIGSALVGIDDISIRESVDYDASIEDINIDKDEVEVGRTVAKVGVRVQNHGVKTLAKGSYQVGFYAGERRFALIEGKEMNGAWGQNLYETEYKPSMDDDDAVSVTARIESEIDMNASNNRSAEANVYVVKPMCPKVSDLDGQSTAEGVALSWTKPDLSGLPVREVIDDFESYRTFDVNRAGKWTIIDEDGAPGSRVTYFFPGSSDPKGWTVMEPSAISRLEGGTNADLFPAYSGEKMMVAYTPADGDCSDWLITPELSGRAQEISFMARAENPEEGREMFEVYYSKTGKAIANMIRLDNIDHRTTLDGWAEFKFAVPENTKYFAVRCVSHKRVCMHIDDFRYESAATPLEVQFVGYNVYRDGLRINNETLTSSSYLDMNANEGESHTYTVRVVYDCGESAHSNQVLVAYNGTISIDADNNSTDDEKCFDLLGRKVSKNVKNEVIVKRGKKTLRK